MSYDYLEEVDLEEEFPELEDDDIICFICGAEAEFQISQTLANGINEDYFLCEECFKKYNQIKVLEELRGNEYWVKREDKKVEEYENETPTEKECRFPFEVTIWEDGSRRIIIK